MMQSLPTPVPTADLNTLLDALALMPSATRKKTGEVVKVLSAATRDGKQWHVMTVPGIITVKAHA